MSVVQIVSWTASDSYLSNVAILDSAIVSISRIDDCICVQSGLSEEDQTTLYLFVVWGNSPKLLVDAAAYLRHSGILSSMKHDAFETNYFVNFNNKVIPALIAPSTEVTLLTLKEGKTKDRLNNILNSVATKPEIANSKYGDLTWGVIEGSPDKLYLLFGWENAKAHTTTVTQPSFSQFVADLRDTAEFKMCHVQLSMHFTKPISPYI